MRTATDISFAAATGRLSASCFVMLRSRGLGLPLLGDREPLALPELSLLATLASGSSNPVGELVTEIAQRTGTDREQLSAFVDELTAHDLIVDRPREPPSSSTARRAPLGPLPSAANGGSIAADESDPMVAATPLVFRPRDGAFEQLDHDGRCVARLDPIELVILSAFSNPTTRAAALEAQLHGEGIEQGRLDAIVARLTDAGLIERFDPETSLRQRGQSSGEREFREGMFQIRRLQQIIARRAIDHDAAELEREARTGTKRTRVQLAHFTPTLAPLSLGMVIAAARQWEGGRLEEHYDFHPSWVTDHAQVEAIREEPGVFLFSNYVWSHHENLGVSAEVKRRSPWSVTIHGGPDTPRNPGDVEAYFRDHPHVDITVRNEGEATTPEVLDALVGAIGDGPPDLSVLGDVPGISFRFGDRVVRTCDRERIADLDTIPSPYLNGEFDIYGKISPKIAIIETNRGCPYGCTFCDWGAATMSRIRKFSLDRVFAELEWCAAHRVRRITLADANFGILERDVEIAEKVAELKAEYGYPLFFDSNYAKNTVKHLRRIVEVVAGAGILSQGLLSLQSMDTETLTTVRRTNIKLERYEDLAREFRKAELPLYVDLMIGLPGATVRGLHEDLQQCVDREVTAKIYQTEMLVNSPMNEPSYREENRIVLEPVNPAGNPNSRRKFVVSTASYSRNDYDEMLALRRLFLLCENYGVLRHVSRFVRQEVDVGEVDLYEGAWRVARTEPERWPTMRFTFDAVPEVMVPPVSWRLFIDEVHDYLTERLEVADDDAFATVFEVQYALLPARERTFPTRVPLAHDYVAWHRAILDAKDDGHRGDWTAIVPHLGELGAGELVVDDPEDICGLNVGFRIDDSSQYANWELRSPVRRALEALQTAI